jgi:crossover junction endodeoxyribonuclease RuvC
MRVIGIDPGYDRLGVAVVERQDGSERLLFSTCIEPERSLPLPERIAEGARAVADILDKYRPDAAAIEKTFFNKNQKTAIAVSEARGALLYVVIEAGVSVAEYTPQEIKIAVTGYGRSDKRGIADMVPRLVALGGERRGDDELDAIAAALTHLASVGNQS